MPYLFPAVIAKGLTHSYGSARNSLQDVDVSVEPNNVVAVLGCSGSGKSTLARLLTGQLAATSGTVHLQGKLSSAAELRGAVGKEIAFVPQESAVLSHGSVAEALNLEGLPTRFGFVDAKERDSRARAELKTFGMSDIDPAEKLVSLSAGKRKLIEIVAALSKASSLIILDDPTAALTDSEAKLLYDALSSRCASGAAVLYLTSRVEEALAVGDVISVLRDGRVIASHKPDEPFIAQLVGEMVGRDTSNEPVLAPRNTGPETVLRVEGLTVEHRVFGLSLKVKRGEVLGLLGLQGAGQSEVIQAVGGVLPRQDGEFYLRSSAMQTKIASQGQALSCGIGLIPEPISLPPQRIDSSLSMLPGRPLRSLNDSNPQKATIGACLRHNPIVLLFDNPTRGLNVACRYEVYRSIQDMSYDGFAIVVASTDPAELIRFCDRIAVMVNGRIMRTIDRTEYSVEKIEGLLRNVK